MGKDDVRIIQEFPSHSAREEEKAPRRAVEVVIVRKKPLLGRVVVHRPVSMNTIDKRVDEALEEVEKGVRGPYIVRVLIPGSYAEPVAPGRYLMYDTSVELSEEDVRRALGS